MRKTCSLISAAITAIVIGSAATLSAFAAEPLTPAQAETNTTLARQFYSLINGGKPDEWRRVFAPNWTATPPLPPKPNQISGYEHVIGAFRAGIPDLKVEQIEVIANDDVVAVRSRVSGTNTAPLFGKAATGKPMAFTAMDIHRIKDGRIVETWHVEDFLGMNRQLAGQ